MDNLERIYIEYFKETFDQLGLELYERSKGQMKFKNKVLRLQLLGDRGLVETDISPLFGEEEFRGIEMFNSLLTLKNSSNKLSDSERRKIMGTRLDYNSQTTFLVASFDQLKTLLNKNNYRTTLVALDNVGQERNNH